MCATIIANEKHLAGNVFVRIIVNSAGNKLYANNILEVYQR